MGIRMADEVAAEPVAAAKPRTHHVREVVVGILIVVACLTFTVATPAAWAKRNFLDTNRFVSRIVATISSKKRLRGYSIWPSLFTGYSPCSPIRSTAGSAYRFNPTAI